MQAETCAEYLYPQNLQQNISSLSVSPLVHRRVLLCPVCLPAMPTPVLDRQTVLDVDPWLEPQVPAIIHRHDLFRKWKDNIEQNEGGYDAFTKGYLKMGFNVQKDNSVIYREWAPNAVEAVLTGDFSEYTSSVQHDTPQPSPTSPDKWNRISHPMKKDQYGVWEVTVPPTATGECAIPHDSKVKVRDASRANECTKTATHAHYLHRSP